MDPVSLKDRISTYNLRLHISSSWENGFSSTLLPTNVSLERDWNPYSLLRSGHITFLSISQKRILRTLDSRKSRGGRRKAKARVGRGGVWWWWWSVLINVCLLQYWENDYIFQWFQILRTTINFLNNLQLEIDQSFDKHSITSLQHVFISKSIFWLRKTFW